MLAARTMIWPMVALVALTMIVAVTMFRRRIAEIRARRIPLRSLATSRGMAALEDVAASDNLRNLFEMPVLFYVACLTLAGTGVDGLVQPALAWAYVALRALHSSIHLTGNRVRQRFAAFAASGVVLLVMWILTALQLAMPGR